MSQKLQFHFTFILLCLLLVNCADSISSSYKDKSPDKKFYEADILDKQFVHFYGLWEVKTVETGWGNLEPSFDYLEVVPFGKFSIIRNDSIILDGKIEILEQNDSLLNITFIASEDRGIHLMSDPEKYIDFHTENKIWMTAPCCDRTNYLLIRK